MLGRGDRRRETNLVGTSAANQALVGEATPGFPFLPPICAACDGFPCVSMERRHKLPLKPDGSINDRHS